MELHFKMLLTSKGREKIRLGFKVFSIKNLKINLTKLYLLHLLME